MFSDCVKVLEKDMKTLSTSGAFLKKETLFSKLIKDSHSIIPEVYTTFTQSVFNNFNQLICLFYTQSTPTTITTIFKYKE